MQDFMNEINAYVCSHVWNHPKQAEWIFWIIQTSINDPNRGASRRMETNSFIILNPEQNHPEAAAEALTGKIPPVEEWYYPRRCWSVVCSLMISRLQCHITSSSFCFHRHAAGGRKTRRGFKRSWILAENQSKHFWGVECTMTQIVQVWAAKTVSLTTVTYIHD